MKLDIYFIHRTMLNKCSYSLGSLRKDNSQSGVIHNLIIKHMINEAHLQHILVSRVVKVLVAGHIVTQGVMGLPATKEGESWAQFNLYAIVHLSEVTGGDVTDLITVVNITGSSRQICLIVYKKNLSTCMICKLNAKVAVEMKILS